MKEIDTFICNCPDKELAEMYSKSWTLSFNGASVSIPFDAVSHNALFDALTTIKGEQ